MPTYDYECASCGHNEEIFQSITERPKKKCPACKKLSFKRLIGSGSGIIFKGTGFYETDYRSKSYQDGAKKASSAVDTKTENKSSSKKEKTEKKSKDKKKKLKAAG